MTGGSEAPSGTVTLLFTDIEGSTRLLQRLGERYGEVLSDHRRLLRDAWNQHGGVEIDTQGDSFFVTFARASDAVAAAIQGQRALAGHAWPDGTSVRVRIGIHTGEPEQVDGNYLGIDVHRAARISSAGHGGQVVLSRTTVDLLPPELPDGVELLDLGEYALKDLVDPEHLFQLLIPGLESRFPELKSVGAARTNLPVAPTALLGRERQLAETRVLLERDDVRLLTLTGPGGTGKTRLATQLATDAMDGFADGAFLVNLEPIADPDLLLSAMAQVLPLGERPADPLDEWLVAHLQTRDMLIVLDNFEHVMGAANAVAQLLARTSGPTFIVTSREPLHVAAEHEYPVPPLALPEPGTSDPATLAASPSVRLFMERGTAARGDLQLTPESAVAVAEICARLDGLPLAIELAAPWLRVLEPQALLDKLGERLDLLSDGARDLPERQRTLRGAIDWSYRLLDDTERAVVDRLGIFAGGWTLEAAEAVCAPVVQGTDLLLALGSLVDKSLVRREPARAGSARFSMLESIRSFALERLVAAGEKDAVAARHAEVYLALAEEAGPELYGPRQKVWMERLTADLDNLRAAMTWATTTAGGEELGLRLTGALTLFWWFLGRYREGLDWSEQMLAAGAGAPTEARVKGLLPAGLLGALLDEDRAKDRLEEALGLARELGDGSSAARTLDWLGIISFFRDEVDEARRLLEESAVEARTVGDLWCLADALGTLSSILPLQGAFDEADVASSEALEIAHRAGDDQGVRMALFGRALTAVRRGDLEDARAMADEGLTISRAIHDTWFIPYFRWLQAVAALGSGDVAASRRYAEEALEAARLVEGPLLIVCALDALAATARAEADGRAALAALEEARRVAAAGGVPNSYVSSVAKAQGELAAETGDLASARRRFEEAIQAARSVGDTWARAGALLSLADAVAEADPAAASALDREALVFNRDMGAKLEVGRALEVAAMLAGREGDHRRAAALLAAADDLLEAAGAVRPAHRRDRHDDVVRAARAALGDDAFDAADDDGRRQGWERAVAQALGEG